MQLSLIESALTVPQVLEQRKHVMSLMKEAMTEGTHYGKIPGCGDKPSLMQSGAQLMCATFRLSASYIVKEETPAPNHREFHVTCRLMHGEAVIADGVGFCSSMESKYRYRNAAAIVEDTGDIVPKAYWDNPNKAEAAKALSAAYDGAKCGVKKVDGAWHIVKLIGGGDGKVENPNPADSFNTILKMAKKRAFVDATITATACNDLFTQDLEDIRDNLAAVESVKEHVTEVATASPAATAKQSAPTQPRHTEAAQQGAGDVWKNVTVENIKRAFSKPESTKTWEAWFCRFSNGQEAGTFDKSTGALAESLKESHAACDVTVKPSKKDPSKWELVSLAQSDDVPMSHEADKTATHETDVPF